jgi:AcrR family transcriptional regulator
MTSAPDRKQDILKAAMDLILAEGAANLTIRKVADAANISTGLVLYHFETKDKLIEEAWRSALAVLGDRINAPNDVGSIEWMEGYLRSRILEWEEAGLLSGLLWLEYWNYVARTPELQGVHSRTYAEWMAVEVERLRQGMKANELRSDLDPTLIADLLHTMICGLLVKSAIDPDVVTPERAFSIAQFFLALISPQDPQPEGQ